MLQLHVLVISQPIGMNYLLTASGFKFIVYHVQNKIWFEHLTLPIVRSPRQ